MSKELPFQMAIRELEARCEELRGLYDAEYNHTQTLREKLAFQSALLERANERMSDAAVSDAWAEQWVSDFASLSGKEDK